jgi:hypothetical protein
MDKVYKAPTTIEEAFELFSEGVFTKLETVEAIRRIGLTDSINIVSKLSSTSKVFGDTTYIVPYSASQQQVVHDAITALETERDGPKPGWVRIG